MQVRYKIGVVTVLVIGIIGWLHFKQPIPSIALPLGRTNEEALHLPDYGHSNILTTKKIDGRLVTTVTPNIIGHPFDIGASGAVGGNETELYLTTEVFFYRHFELLAGMGITYPVIHPEVMLAFGYRLPWRKVDNVSFFVGHDLQNFIAGIYWRFGSN